MTELTRHGCSYDPWIIRFSFLPFVPFFPAPSTPSGLTRRGRPRSSLLITLRCRLRRNAIDRELAAGVEPESSECRDLRASELTAGSNREALAAAYERHLAAARSVPPPSVVPVNCRGVRTAAPRLAHLAKRLRDDPRVRAQGVARARLLLTERDSALHATGDGLSLVDEVCSTLALL
jgi:hypothetical protein